MQLSYTLIPHISVIHTKLVLNWVYVLANVKHFSSRDILCNSSSLESSSCRRFMVSSSRDQTLLLNYSSTNYQYKDLWKEIAQDFKTDLRFQSAAPNADSALATSHQHLDHDNIPRVRPTINTWRYNHSRYVQCIIIYIVHALDIYRHTYHSLEQQNPTNCTTYIVKVPHGIVYKNFIYRNIMAN